MRLGIKRGFLIFELLIGLVLIAAVMSAFAPLTQALMASSSIQKNVTDNMAVSVGLESQLLAQWQRLGQFGCNETGRSIVIGSNFNRPSRIPQSTFETESDWLQGGDVGLCAAYGQISDDSLSVDLPCDAVSAGQRIVVNSCAFGQQSSLLGISSGRFAAAVDGERFISKSVLVGTLSNFFWYVGEGRQNQNALWRKPVTSGNAVELFPNVQFMRIYPILDRDLDGVSDEIVVQYGAFPIAEVTGILIEYSTSLKGCDASNRSIAEYETLRGDIWFHDGICSAVGRTIVPLGAVI